MAEADTSPMHRVQGAETRLEAVQHDVSLQCFAEPFGRDGVHVRGVDLVRGGQEIVEVGEHGGSHKLDDLVGTGASSLQTPQLRLKYSQPATCASTNQSTPLVTRGRRTGFANQPPSPAR